MSTNCLVTKLKGTVDNANLLKMGEIRFGVEGTAAITIRAISGKSVVATIIEGTGTFNATHTNTVTLTDSTTEASITASTPCIISINDKYSIETLAVNNGQIDYNDASTLEYCHNLKSIIGFSFNSTDFMTFKNKANATSIRFNAKNPFNINNITGYNSLKTLITPNAVDGNINTINLNFPIIKNLGLGGVLTGDASTFATSVESPILASTEASIQNTNITWSTTRPNTAPFLELIYINLGDDLDAMLINQANLTYSGSDATGWSRGLSVYGNLGSSQEVTDAIAAIKAKGLPVHINGRAY